MSSLIFFTESFPYGKGEAFIENEIGFLSQKFDKVYILPKTGKTQYKRELPDNCITFPPIFQNSTDLLFKGMFCLAPIFYFIQKLFSEQAYVSFYRLKKYIATSIVCRAILSNKNFKYLNEIAVNNTVYFYWGIGIAYVLPFIKNKEKKIVRFHGTDLYLERRPEKYIPFRKEVFEHLSKAIFISQQGLEYAKKTFRQYHFNAYCSYLGTKDYGVSEIISQDSSIHIVSCSNIIPGKRVGLILESLLLIPNYSIKWTHIGGGTEFNSLQQKIRNIPENLTISLTGSLSYQDVIRYYLDHPVDLFINVSSSEGLPVSIMEAISFNIPIIATNVGGTSEIVTPESGILLPANVEATELAQKIIYLYENKHLFQPKQLWLKKFSADKNYPQFIKEFLQ